MQAFISSAIDAYVFLQGLDETAGRMAYYRALNGSSKRAVTKGTALRLTKNIDGCPASITIQRHDKGTLVASLESRQTLVAATAKRRLAALLIPLISKYIASHHSSVAPAGRVRIVFGEAATLSRGKTCLLFAEDAAIHDRPTFGSNKPMLSDRNNFSAKQSFLPSRKSQRLVG